MTVKQFAALVVLALAGTMLAVGGWPLTSARGADGPAEERCVTPDDVLATADGAAVALGLSGSFEMVADPAHDRAALFIHMGDETMVYLFEGACLVGINPLTPMPAEPAPRAPVPVRPVTPA